MKKIYSLVLMAAVLLIGTNAWAATHTAADADELEAAWKKAVSGDVIQLTDDVTLAHTLWLGTINMNDEAKSITLDLGGKTLNGAVGTTAKMFIITHGELIVRNGNIVQSGTVATSSSYVIFHVCGSTYKTVNAKTALSGYYSHLVISEDVTLTAHSNAIAIDRMDTWVKTAIATKGLSTPQALPYNTNVYRTDRGLANGARVDIYGKIFAQKYGIKANGNMGAPASSSTGIARNGYIQNPDGEVAYAIEAGEELLWSPFIHIHSGARLETTLPSSSAAIAAYSGGYSRWLIEGYCEGSTGVYVKSGQLEIKDAVVKSNYTGEYNAAMVNRTSGVDAGGSGIVMESASAYAGGMDVTVSGTTEVTPTVGYAVDEAVTQPSQETKVNNINIEGGKFHEGEEGTIKVTQVTANAQGQQQSSVVVISGGTVEGGNNGVAIGDQNLSQFLQGQSESTHAVVVETDEQGNETIVISNGDAPVQANSVIAKTSGQSCNWISTADTQETLEKDLTLTELQISSADYYQTLIIKEGYKLEVGRVVLGAKAQIVVKPGAQFIVTGEQGIAAYQSRNLVLETSQDAQPTFLIHPDVESNRHPDATVQFISKGYRRADNSLAWQRFGIPSFGALVEMTADQPTAVAAFDFQNNTWVNIGLVGSTLDYSKMAEPFAYYQMANNVNVENIGTLVTMKGQLYGNDSPALSIKGNAWNGFANSYMAPINGPQLLSMIPSTVDKAFYLNKIDGNQASWEPQTMLNIEMGIMEDILPMQPFLIKNSLAGANASVNYEAAVYNPAMGISPNAPARRAMADLTAAQLVVKGANGFDKIIVAEGAEFTAEFDNGYDAVKYMNDGVNMYVSANEKMSNFATDNLENTYVGFQTVEGGNYTIEFANVQGNDLTLIDHETNARIAMVNGSVYEFTAAANSVNDYRFEIVSRDNAPTAIENTEAVKSAKGIYTLTGQYVGEMNVWNTLPAGVYVVNGEKLVK